MTTPKKTFEVKVERTIPAPAGDVYTAWLNRKVPGTPWNMGDKLLLNAKVDGFFYWLVSGTAHYGRFTKLEPARQIQYTWVSRYTSGEESMVTVTFKKKGVNTLMTLLHTGLPDADSVKAHTDGWTMFLDAFPKHFEKASKKEKKGAV